MPIGARTLESLVFQRAVIAVLPLLITMVEQKQDGYHSPTHIQESHITIIMSSFKPILDIQYNYQVVHRFYPTADRRVYYYKQSHWPLDKLVS